MLGFNSSAQQCEAFKFDFAEWQALCFDSEFNEDKIDVVGSRLSKQSDNEWLLSGDVCMRRVGLRLTTPEINYQKQGQVFELKQNTWLRSETQLISAQSGTIDSRNETAAFEQLQYFMLNSSANGTADSVYLTNNRSKFKNLTFSSCMPQSRSWEIVAKKAKLDHQQGMGTFKGAKLKIHDVPLLYIPWIKLPLDGRRRSGFLMPNVSYSNNTGLDLSIPYYLNLAPQYDATLTPRYLQNHGLMLGLNFRYLSRHSRGELDGSYLPNDDENGKDRGLLNFKHHTQFNQHWYFNADLNHVSDSAYFEDFASGSFLTSTPYLRSQAGFGGTGESWRFYIGADRYQVLSQNTTEPYQKRPELLFSWFDEAPNGLVSYGLNSQVVNFYRDEAVGAWRSDLTPWVEKQWSNSWGYVKPKLQYRSTHYQFDDERQDLSRNLPIMSVDSGLVLEKWSKDESLKTIEPRLFYVYAPYREQQDIPLFDSHTLTFGSGLLFQTNRFSGADRQADMNQLATAVTHRSFSAEGKELWNLTVGQINYFDEQLVQLDGVSQDLTKSPLIAEYNLHFYRNWKAGLALHYQQSSQKLERGSLSLQHRTERGKVVNFAYRFIRDQIEQIDTSAVMPINDTHRLVGRWNYSLKDDKTIEALFGYEHKSCCWAIRLMARHYLVDEIGNSNNGIYVEFELNGLGALGRNPRRILKQTILGYDEAF